MSTQRPSDDRRKIFVVAHIPLGLEQAWLQWVRDFDAKNPGCHFEIGADAPDMTMREMVEVLRVNPELTFAQVIQRKRPDGD